MRSTDGLSEINCCGGSAAGASGTLAGSGSTFGAGSTVGVGSTSGFCKTSGFCNEETLSSSPGPDCSGALFGCSMGLVSRELSATVFSSEPPGSNTTLAVTLSLKRRSGQQKKSLYVTSNDRGTPYYQLRLVGKAVAAFYVQPQHINFGDIAADAHLQQEITLMHPAGVALSVTNCFSSGKHFAIEQLPGKEKGRQAFAVSTVPPFALGLTSGQLKILTDHPKYREFSVGVRATVASDLVVVPREIIVKEQEGQIKPVTRYLAVRSRTGKPFKLLGVEAPDEGITVKTQALRGGGYRCELGNIMPFPDLDEKNVIIKTDIKSTEQIPVPIRVVTD